jgi:hypothetical protein
MTATSPKKGGRIRITVVVILTIAVWYYYNTGQHFPEKAPVEILGKWRSAVEWRTSMMELKQSFEKTKPVYERIDTFFFAQTSPDPNFYFATGSPLFDPGPGIMSAASAANLTTSQI